MELTNSIMDLREFWNSLNTESQISAKGNNLKNSWDDDWDDDCCCCVGGFSK